MHTFKSTYLQPPPWMLGPIPFLSSMDAAGLPLEGESRCRGAPGMPFIAGEGPFEKPANNWKNVANSTASNSGGKEARNRKAPARLTPSPRRCLAGTELLQRQCRAVISPAQELRFARSCNPSSTVTCFQQTGCLCSGWQLPCNSRARGGVGSSHRPGATRLSPLGWVASGAPWAECHGGDGPISFLQPAADEQNKKHVVQAWLHRRGKAELSSCSLFISPPKSSY